MGKVYLIGAGPGNEELVTLKAIRVLKECTAVLYDRLSGESLLKYLNKDCKIFYCGKEPGCHYKSQKEINDMLVKLAKEGHTVGRIKGGDPYVFGRGGEESIRLSEEGISFEVISGITSAIAVLNYAGIPVTHRGIARSFHVFTGRSEEGLSLQWEYISKLSGTLIFLMGMEHIEQISKNLIKNGKSENTPAGVIMRGTTSKQKMVIGNLINIAQKAQDEKLKAPCVIVVGEVVSFSKTLNWYNKMKLSGINVCITRSKEQSYEIKNKLLKLGAEVTEINAIKILNTTENMKQYLNRLTAYDFIVMSSVNSVNIFFNYLKEKRYDIRNIKAKFAVIGTATEKTLMERGIYADIRAKEFVSESLKEELMKKVKKSDRILIPCSKHSRRKVAQSLIDFGCTVDEVYIYEPVQGDVLNKKAFDEVDVVFLTSPSTVKNMINIVGLDKLREKINIAIGPVTFKELENQNISGVMSDEFTTDGMINKLVELRHLQINN